MSKSVLGTASTTRQKAHAIAQCHTFAAPLQKIGAIPFETERNGTERNGTERNGTERNWSELN